MFSNAKSTRVESEGRAYRIGNASSSKEYEFEIGLDSNVV